MDNRKYIGMDVHKETISIAVLNSAGKLVMETVIESKAITIVQFVQGLRGDLHVTLEEGTWAAWLYDLLRPYVTEVLVCDPRKNALLKVGNKSDRIDARKPAERGGKNAKKRAVVAVARKLAVLLHKLWVSGEDYEPLRNSQKAVSAVA